MEEKQKQLKLSQQQHQHQHQQQQQQISPKSIAVVQLGAKRTVSQKDEDVRQNIKNCCAVNYIINWS
jgi:hypothetical protein